MLGTWQKEQKTMKLQEKLLAVAAFVGLAILPAFGQMAGMSGSKKMAMCCMGGMKMGKMKPGGMDTGQCCMGGAKAAGMKMSKTMVGMSAGEKMKMAKCCMAGMKVAKMKPSGKGMPGGMGDDKKPGPPPMGSGKDGNR